MRVSYAVLVAAISLLGSADAVSSATISENSPMTGVESPLAVTAARIIDQNKRSLRSAGKQGDDDSEERMFVGTINGVLGKVGSVVETGGAKIAKEAPKLEKYQQWLYAHLTPSQVRVDVLKKEPWMKLEYLADHPDFYQYAKFMVEYKRLHPHLP